MNTNIYIDGPVGILRGFFPRYDYARAARFHGDDLVLIEIRKGELTEEVENHPELRLMDQGEAALFVRSEEFRA